MLHTSNTARVETLRREMAALEAPARRAGQGHVGFGIRLVDEAAGGGLALGRMHEVNGRAAWSFVGVMAGRTRGAILWCARVRHDHVLYPPGLGALGCDARRLVMADCSSGADALWAAEEGLRSGAVGTVVLEGERALDLSAARRLQLAAEEGGALGLTVSVGCEALFPAASTRWRLEPLEGERFELEMTRNRNGQSGAWRVRRDETAYCLSLAEEPGHRPHRKAQTGLA